MVLVENTLTNKRGQIVLEDNETITVNYPDTNTNEVIPKAKFERWFIRRNADKYIVEIGTSEVTITPDNLAEMINLYPEIQALNLNEYFNQFNTVSETIVPVAEIIPQNTTLTENYRFTFINTRIIEGAKPKIANRYLVNNTEVEVVEYTEGDWKGWITAVVINGKRYKNLKKAFESLNLDNTVTKAFSSFRRG